MQVVELADQHLLAEYREIKMLFKSLVRSSKSKNGIDKKRISPTYTLNKGHAYFFYDKVLFVEKRFDELVREMKRRGFATNAKNLYDPQFDYSCITEDLRNDYTPNEAEIEINRERIREKIALKPQFYKYMGERIYGD